MRCKVCKETFDAGDGHPNEGLPYDQRGKMELVVECPNEACDGNVDGKGAKYLV